jgi:hypothetical protein
LLWLSDPAALQAPIEADQLADRAVGDLLTTGTTSVKIEESGGVMP